MRGDFLPHCVGAKPTQGFFGNRPLRPHPHGIVMRRLGAGRRFAKLGNRRPHGDLALITRRPPSGNVSGSRCKGERPLWVR
jgi:hypothetical protein